jgi:hypothetical protein
MNDNMRSVTALLFLALCINAGTSFSRTQQASRRIRKEVITVIDSIRGFQREVVEYNIADAIRNYFIPYTSLESVGKITFDYLDISGKPIRATTPEITDIQIPSTSFYSCSRARKIAIKENSSFRVQYTSTCSDLLMLCKLHFSWIMAVDTFYYELRIPAGYHLAFNVSSPEMLSYFKVDTVISPKFHIYSFTAVQKFRSEPTPWIKNDNSIRKKYCIARILITPEKFAGRESVYFNQRLSSMYTNSVHLSDQSKILIDNITRNCTSDDSVINTLIKFIRAKIKYLDVEIGYGYFVPDEVNDVLNERQGDCKGMSNLLCQALRSKGIEAYMAATASILHECDMDFPSLSSSDHMICVVRSGEDWLFLDPTDKAGFNNVISPSIQGRTAFIIGYRDGLFVSIPVVKPDLNAESFRYRLKATDNIIGGILAYTASGGSMGWLNQVLSMTGTSGKERIATEIIRQWVQNSIPSNPLIFSYTDSVSLSCDIRFGPSIYIITPGTGYLSLGFLPVPVSFTQQDLSGCDILLDHSILKKVNAVIDLGKDVSSLKFPGAAFHEGGFHFNLSCKPEKNLVIINYTFRYDNNIIREEDIPMYKKFRDFIDLTLKQVISIK